MDVTVWEAIRGQRSTWRFKPDPVPEEHVRKVIEAATYAPSGGNFQPWRFVVVRDGERRRQVRDLYLRAWDVYRPAAQRLLGSTIPRSMSDSADHLARNFHLVPVHIVACMLQRPPAYTLRDEEGKALDVGSEGSSVFPAVQNLMLAAVGLGLATRLLTLHRIFETELKSLLAIPAEVETVALIPLGYPDGQFKLRKRLSVDDITHWERWRAE